MCMNVTFCCATFTALTQPVIDALLSTCPIVYSIELFRVKRSRDIETSRLMLMSHRMLQHCYLIRYNACEYAKPKAPV